VVAQHAKDTGLHAVRQAIGGVDDLARLDPSWRSALKLHTATLPLAPPPNQLLFAVCIT